MSLNEALSIIIPETGATLVMVVITTIIGYIFGIPLGIILTLTDEKGLRPNQKVYAVLDFIVNIFRSIPFIILILFMSPLTFLLVRTTFGIKGVLVPLSISAIPFIARMIESSLKEVDPGVIEASVAMGASLPQIIFHVYLVEARSSIIYGLTIVIVSIIGYVAMAGAVGAGGIGDVAIRYGYQRYDNNMMYAAVIITLILVEIVQLVGNFIAKKLDKRQ